MKFSENEIDTISEILAEGSLQVHPILYRRDLCGTYEVIMEMELIIDGEPTWNGCGKLSAPWINRLLSEEDDIDENLPLGTSWEDIL